MKWLPPPSVPSWLIQLAFLPTRFCTPGWRCMMRRSPLSKRFAAWVRASRSLWLSKPTGTSREIWLNTFLSELSSSSAAVSESRRAIMPQPISTPTAAGMIALFLGITEPTVAPMPRCTSGIAATWWCTIGSFEMLTSCCRAAASSSVV